LINTVGGLCYNKMKYDKACRITSYLVIRSGLHLIGEAGDTID